MGVYFSTNTTECGTKYVASLQQTAQSVDVVSYTLKHLKHN